MGSAAAAAAMYEVARFRLAQVLTKEAALSVELAVSMVEVVEAEREARTLSVFTNGEREAKQASDSGCCESFCYSSLNLS